MNKIYCEYLQISEEELECYDNRDLEDPDYQITPDVTFRLLGEKERKNMKGLDLLWYVTTEEDVGSFEISVQNMTSGKSVIRENLSYTYRAKSFPDLPTGKYHVCINTQDTENNFRPTQRGQCRVFDVNISNTLTPTLFSLTSIIVVTMWNHLSLR